MLRRDSNPQSQQAGGCKPLGHWDCTLRTIFTVYFETLRGLPKEFDGPHATRGPQFAFPDQWLWLHKDEMRHAESKTCKVLYY
jgi:hypothetical protein